jgi:hypothetical protein
MGQDLFLSWLKIWQEVGAPYPELELPLRLYETGLRYLRAKDERVLFDLLQQERKILRDLFGLPDRDEM